MFCEVILYIQRTQKHAEQKRERERSLRGREERVVGVFFLSSSSVTVLLLCRLDGERERVILNFHSRSLFPFCIVVVVISRRDERTTGVVVLTTTRRRTREKE